jgi:hypothetical protein
MEDHLFHHLSERAGPLVELLAAGFWRLLVPPGAGSPPVDSGLPPNMVILRPRILVVVLLFPSLSCQFSVFNFPSINHLAFF